VNLQTCRVVLRERTIGEILDLACLLCSSAALGLHLRLAAAVLLPAYAVCLALYFWLEWHPAWVWVFACGFASILQGAFTVGIGRWLFAEKLSVREVLGAWLKRLTSYFGAWLLSRLLLAVSSLALLFPVLIVWVRVLFVHEASLLEAASAGAAIQRSGRFTDSMRGRAWGMMMALAISGPLAVLLAEVLFTSIVSDLLQLGEPFPSLWKVGISPWALLGLFAAVPFVATARFLMYVDGRTRSDAWDVQVRFMAIAARPQTPSALGQSREAAA
jgi:hypothetical protein